MSVSLFDDYMKFQEFMKKEKDKAEGKGKWTVLFWWTFLAVTFPLVLGLSVFTYQIAKHWAALLGAQ